MFGPPHISRDGHLVGWTELRADGASYAYPVGLQLDLQGHRFDIGCSLGMPWAWEIVTDNLVGLQCAFPHGRDSRSLQLVDIVTGKVVDHFEPLENSGDGRRHRAPRWARENFSQ